MFVIFQTKNKSNGGVESITQVIERLKGWDVHVISQLETARAERWRKIGAKVSIFNKEQGTNKISKGLYFLRFGWFVKRYVMSNDLEIIHCNDIDSLFYSTIALKKFDGKVVFNIRGIKKKGNVYGKKWRRSMNFVDHVLMLSSEMRDQIIERLNVEPTKVSFIYSIVDTSVINSNVVPVTTTDRPHVGIVGAIMEIKQQALFIEHTLPNLVNRYPELLVSFVGDFDPENDMYSFLCQSLVDNIGLWKNVEFACYQTNVAQWYKIFDVNLVLSGEIKRSLLINW